MLDISKTLRVSKFILKLVKEAQNPKKFDMFKTAFVSKLSKDKSFNELHELNIDDISITLLVSKFDKFKKVYLLLLNKFDIFFTFVVFNIVKLNSFKLFFENI